MRLRSYLPRTGPLVEAIDWIRGVTQILQGGATIADQMAGEVVKFRWNSDSPPTVATRLATAPVAVQLLAARLTDGSADTTSGGAVSWAWAPTNGKPAVLISNIDALDASTDYDVTLWMMGG